MSTLDPDVERLLELGRQAGARPFEALTPEQARTAYAAGWDVVQPTAVEVASIRDITVPGKGGGLPLRVCRGIGMRPEERLPCLPFLHGGGWVLGNRKAHGRPSGGVPA